ncbi:MAG: hypothetical protein KGL35_01595 [Bradyrhizobium sp.]|nr:hypothetical protein [Bradyrhizobium sp.]
MNDPLFKMATRRPHVFPPIWEAVRVKATPSRPEQLERACRHCGLVKITIFGSTEPRAWRWGNANWQFCDHVEPDCVPESSIQQASAENAA